jgi:hypothetical protein
MNLLISCDLNYVISQQQKLSVGGHKIGVNSLGNFLERVRLIWSNPDRRTFFDATLNTLREQFNGQIVCEYCGNAPIDLVWGEAFCNVAVVRSGARLCRWLYACDPFHCATSRIVGNGRKPIDKH